MRKFFCECPFCAGTTRFNDLDDSFIVCKNCNRILGISNVEMFVKGTQLSTELESRLMNKLNELEKDKLIKTQNESKPTQVLLEGDDILSDFI